MGKPQGFPSEFTVKRGQSFRYGVFAGLELSLPLSPSPRARTQRSGPHTNFSLRAMIGAGSLQWTT
jgi:hypothetical protein